MHKKMLLRENGVFVTFSLIPVAEKFAIYETQVGGVPSLRVSFENAAKRFSMFHCLLNTYLI